MTPKSYRRLVSKFTVGDSCWLWTAALDKDGYGSFWLEGHTCKAHRVVYELLVGPIPDGMHLDHVRNRGCTNRHCVNPKHLEPVTCAENIRRGANGGLTRGAQIKARTHCPSGHPYEGEHLYIYPNGVRECRTCRSARQAKRRQQLKEMA